MIFHYVFMSWNKITWAQKKKEKEWEEKQKNNTFTSGVTYTHNLLLLNPTLSN